MLAITKISGGFVMNESDYFFQDYDNKAYEIISDSQVHIGTNEGVILLDLSVSIDDNMFSDINEFVTYLYS